MIRILKNILPSYFLKSSENYTLNYLALISINIDDLCFLLEISFDQFTIEPFLEELRNTLSFLHPNQDLTVHFISDISIDLFNPHKKNFCLSNHYQDFFLFLPLDFATYLSNKLQYTHYYTPTNFYNLELELYRFQPRFLSTELWLTFLQKDLQELFHYIITNNLVTPKMLALFLKKIKLPNISLYFSKNTFQEISNEINLLSSIENPNLLSSIYYIIENNLILFLQHSPKIPSVLSFHHQIINFYQNNIYKNALTKLDLQKIPCFYKLAQSTHFSLFINRIPYHSLLSFLQNSIFSNREIIKKGFSPQGQKQLLQDLNTSIYPIQKSHQCLQNIIQLIFNNNSIVFEDLVHKLITKTRDWELLARECDIRDLLLCFDTLPSKYRKNISGIISILYQSYHQQIIVFPKITERSILKAQNNVSIAIYKLYFLQILDSHLEIF
ncbi:MAG: hypothetical protein KFW21_00540 [Spirochaetota bacterium]|nr:hypothetical protein [Spirochaetota bacterium]